MVANALDVTIAYLRRVHLFTFYNGCTFSNNVGSILGNNHPAGVVVHVRLKGPDEILKKAKEENADMYDDLSMGDEGNDDQSKKHDESNVKGEDQYDDKTRGENNSHSAETKDMLVMRLDDSIEKV